MISNKRLVLEYNAMRERWGERPRLCKNASGKRLWWEFDIHLEGNTLPIKIVYPDNYPSAPPQIITSAPLPGDTPHVLPGNWPIPQLLAGGTRLCWNDPRDTRSINKWAPSRDTAALCISIAQQWFLAFLVWYSTPNRTFGDWPVPDSRS